MDKYLNNDEERLFDLLENKDHDQLTEEELAFVSRHLSLTEYVLQRRMIVEAGAVYPTVPPAQPLVLPANRFTRKTVPLYQAIAAVAATIALFLSLWPGATPPGSDSAGADKQLSHTDTVIRTQIVLDTVIRYVRYRDKQPAVAGTNTTQDKVVQASQLRVLDAAPIALPEITEELVRTKGSSLKDDSASRAILSSVYQSTIW
jgi:hypothetical protein